MTKDKIYAGIITSLAAIRVLIEHVRANKKACKAFSLIGKCLLAILIIVAYTLAIGRYEQKKALAVYQRWLEEYKTEQEFAALKAIEADPYTVQLNAEEFKFTLVSIPENVANLRLVIEASAPHSHGVSNAFDKASAFADPFSVVAETMDIKAAYDNKNGAPSAGRPKIFMRYFYVNAVTGEKSADILKEVELGATNDPFDESQNGGGGE